MINIGENKTIGELAETVGRTVRFEGEIVWDSSYPNGTPRNLLEIERITAFAWKAALLLIQGIEDVYRWFLEQQDSRTAGANKNPYSHG